MGSQMRVTCRHCRTVFKACDGGGFFFHLLHCQKCGTDMPVTQDEMGDAFGAEQEIRDAWVATNVPPCSCGGRFTFSAKARCPTCHADDWDTGNVKLEMLYD
jgi:hypothetical protein